MCVTAWRFLKFQLPDVTSDQLGHNFQRTGCFSQTPHLVLVFTHCEDHWGLTFSLVRLELILKCLDEVTYSLSTFFIDQFYMLGAAF